jgi:hypothetical protein
MQDFNPTQFTRASLGNITGSIGAVVIDHIETTVRQHCS